MTVAPRRVAVVDDQFDVAVDTTRFADLVTAVLDAEGVDPALEVTVSFVASPTMAGLRAEHYDGAAEPTDVLSFPIDDDVTEGVPGLLGDVVVCPAVCRDRAPGRAGLRLGHDGSVESDLVVMVVHGLMHLLGHDHDDDESERVMVAGEEHHLTRWFAREAPLLATQPGVADRESTHS